MKPAGSLLQEAGLSIKDMQSLFLQLLQCLNMTIYHNCIMPAIRSIGYIDFYPLALPLLERFIAFHLYGVQ